MCKSSAVAVIVVILRQAGDQPQIATESWLVVGQRLCNGFTSPDSSSRGTATRIERVLAWTRLVTNCSLPYPWRAWRFGSFSELDRSPSSSPHRPCIWMTTRRWLYTSSSVSVYTWLKVELVVIVVVAKTTNPYC